MKLEDKFWKELDEKTKNRRSTWREMIAIIFNPLVIFNKVEDIPRLPQ